MLLEWRLKEIRFKQQKKLNASNLYLYKSITSYIQNSELRGTEKEEILQQIMDMMLQAQIEDKPMTLIIGNDYEEFCKLIIEEYSGDKSTTYKNLNYIQKGLLWFILTSIILMILRSALNSSLNLGITVDYLIIACVISLIMIPAVRKSSQENASLASWYQRLYTVNNGVTKSGSKAFIIMIITVGLMRFVLEKTVGPNIFNYTILLYSAIPYVVLIFIIIGLIESYKIFHNKIS